MTSSRRVLKSTNGHATPNVSRHAALYQQTARATRGGHLFNAFPYPTKVSPETIALFIGAHTQPGDLVLDGFAGSGSTGLGALLCANPPQSLKDKAEELGLDINWGPRRAVLYELGVLGAFISKVLCSPPEPNEFELAAKQLLDSIESEFGWMYDARDPDGNQGRIRYVVWADVMICPRCKRRTTYWDACVSQSPANISKDFHCPHCNRSSSADSATRVMETSRDSLTSTPQRNRLRKIAFVYGSTEGKTWSRPANRSDAQLAAKIKGERIPSSVPKVELPWGDLYRAGYHEGMTHLHHFYTQRNLIVFGHLWKKIDDFPRHLRDALRFLLLSYNSSHSTLMTRVVAKKGQKDLVVTSSQPGVLYVSGLPVEKNIFAGVRRKLKTISCAFRQTYGTNDLVEVKNASCLSLKLANESVDYVFTDPPFGGNIPYAEVNFVNEAWLGKITKQREEITVSQHQNKTITDYEMLLSQAMKEVHRVLKNDKATTLVFHSSTAEVWNSLSSACSRAGFNVSIASVLDKTQASFKQVTTEGAVRGDPILLLTKGPRSKVAPSREVWGVTRELMRQASNSGEPVELSPQRLYSRLVAYYMSRHQSVPVDAAEFYGHISERLVEYGGATSGR